MPVFMKLTKCLVENGWIWTLMRSAYPSPYLRSIKAQGSGSNVPSLRSQASLYQSGWEKNFRSPWTPLVIPLGSCLLHPEVTVLTLAPISGPMWFPSLCVSCRRASVSRISVSLGWTLLADLWHLLSLWDKIVWVFLKLCWLKKICSEKFHTDEDLPCPVSVHQACKLGYPLWDTPHADIWLQPCIATSIFPSTTSWPPAWAALASLCFLDFTQ